MSVQKKLAQLVTKQYAVSVVRKDLAFNGDICPRGAFLNVLEGVALGSGDPEVLKAFMSPNTKRSVAASVYSTLLAANTAQPQQQETSITTLLKKRLLPARCAITGREFLYDDNQGEVSKISYEAYLKSLPHGEREEFEQSTQLVVLQYDPYDLTPVKRIELSGENLARVNAYKPPAWRKQGQPPENPTIPKIFADFYEQLFPDVEVRAYVINWLRQAVMLRNETILVMNGVKGIGKGLFCEIVKGLVGEANYALAAVSSLDSNFNAILADNRVIVFDEIEVDKSAHTRLKRYANSYQTIERKGVDAVEPEETFNSYIISNNDTSDMYLEADDRRFSVVEMTDVTLIDAWSEEDRAELVAATTDMDLIRELGYWLIECGEDLRYNTFTAWKGPRFYQLVYSSLKAWQRYIVDYVSGYSGDSNKLPLEDIKREYRKVSGKDSKLPSNISTIQDFLMNYKHNGNKSIARLKLDSEDGWVLVDFVSNTQSPDL